MFADQMKMGDSVKIQLLCAHRFQGGEMKCLNCGQYFSVAINTVQTVDNTVQFTTIQCEE